MKEPWLRNFVDTCLSVYITDGIAIQVELVKSLLMFKAEWGNKFNGIGA
jgi:hypothetical protein